MVSGDQTIGYEVDTGNLRRKTAMKNIVVSLIFLVLATAFSKNVEAVHTGWFAPDETARLKNPFDSKAGAVAEGKKIYDKNCAKCHGAKGKGDGVSAGSMQIELPDFTNKEVTSAETDGNWFWKTRTGQFEMPPFQLILKDEEIWKAIVYIRTMAK